jgi:hypothetical protein
VQAWVLAHAIGDQANEPSSRDKNGSTLCAFMREPFPFARPNSPETQFQLLRRNYEIGITQ